MRRALALAIFSCTCGPSAVIGPPFGTEAGVTTSHAVTTFAIDAIFLGDTDISGGAPSNVAWKEFGFNLDQRLTTATSSDVCKLRPDADVMRQIDGENGIDNSFGSSILPILETATSTPSFSHQQTQWIRQGRWTLEMSITGLSSDLQQTAIGLDAQAFVGAPLDATPAFDTTTDWPVLPSSLNDGGSLASGALAHFSNVYVTNGTVVAEGASQPLVLPLDLTMFSSPPVFPFPLRINHPVIVFDTTTSRGMIAGVLDPKEGVDTLLGLAHRVSPSLCATSATDGIVDQYLMAEDILADGTNAPGVDCNAISIGVGFTAKRIANPTSVGVDPVPIPDLCDAGADASDATTD